MTPKTPSPSEVRRLAEQSQRRSLERRSTPSPVGRTAWVMTWGAVAGLGIAIAVVLLLLLS